MQTCAVGEGGWGSNQTVAGLKPLCIILICLYSFRSNQTVAGLKHVIDAEFEDDEESSNQTVAGLKLI